MPKPSISATLANDANFIWNLGVVLASHAKQNIILEGPPGTGKSRFATSLAGSQPVYRITCHQDLLPSELIGHHIGESGGATPWQPGPATRAWTEGGLLILDEITELSSESKTICHQILDDAVIAQLHTPDGRHLKPHPNFRCIATTNRSALELPEALLDRFPIRITVPVPSPEAIATLPEDLREVVFATYISCGWTPQRPNRPFITFRELRTYGDLRNATDPLTAARLVWQNRAEDVLNHIQTAATKTRPKSATTTD